MPKKSPEDMEARKSLILNAAKKLFANQGYAATSIQDIAQEAQVSFGNIYTHFSSKNAILEELSGSYSQTQNVREIDFLALLEHLKSEEGLEDAKLDLNLWVEATRDATVNASVQAAMDAFRKNLRRTIVRSGGRTRSLTLLEALALGVEVQRSLGRTLPSSPVVRRLMGGAR